jgi:hypothetical protein
MAIRQEAWKGWINADGQDRLSVFDDSGNFPVICDRISDGQDNALFRQRINLKPADVKDEKVGPLQLSERGFGSPGLLTSSISILLSNVHLFSKQFNIAKAINASALRFDFGVSKLLLASAPQFFCGLPQCKSKGRNDDRSQRGNARIMSVNEAARTTDINSDDGSESGWIFFGGRLIVGIFVLNYATLKVRR